MTSRRQCAEFVAYVIENVRNIPLVRIKSMDKKSERSVLHHIKIESGKSYLDARRRGDNLTAIFHAMTSTVIESNGCYLPLPIEVHSISLLIGVCNKVAQMASKEVVQVAQLFVDSQNMNNPQMVETFTARFEAFVLD
jgi:hypothetical protein